MRYKVPVFIFLLIVLCNAGLRAEDADEIDTTIWDKSINLRGAIGYKDNVILSRNNREGSAFWQTEAEVMAFRIDAEQGLTLTLFASGEDRRYFSADSIDHEQSLVTQAKVDWDFKPDWQTGLSLTYSYLNAVFDASATEDIFETLLVKSHRISLAPYISRDLPWNSTLEFQFNIERQFFNEPLDDYWEYSPQVSWKKRYGNRSDVTLSYTLHDRPYDTREALTLQFERIPNTTVEYLQHELESTWNHSWDTNRYWRTRTRLGVVFNQDNGDGFFDYTRYRFSERFGYYRKKWQAVIEGKVLYYDYARQVVFGTSDVRQFWEYVVGVRAERNLLRKLKVFLESEHEWLNSNVPIDEYQVNTVMTGVDWEF